MKTTAVLLILIALLATAGVAMTQSSASFKLPWHVIAGGGATSTSDSYRVSGTVGQASASPPRSESSHFRLAGGVWAGLADADARSPTWEIYLPLVQRGSNG